jgi:carboxypeptidase family protein
MPGSQLVMLAFCLTLSAPATSVAGPPAAGNPLEGSIAAGSPASGKIVGRVTKGGKPYAYANVILLGTRVGTQTNEDGWFRLERVPAGKQELQVQAIYCDKQSVTVSVRSGRPDTLAVELCCPFLGCAEASKEDLAPECFRPNPDERRRVGWPCLVHPWCALTPDTVRIAYGYQLARPGFAEIKRHSFPNAAMSWDGGCVVGLAAFTEVAYCRDCRRAFDRWYRKQNGGG